MTSQSGARRAVAAFADTAATSSDSVRALFYITGAADPGLLPRLIDPIAKLGYVPSRLHASSEGGDGSELAVDLRVSHVPRRAAELVERCLRAVIGVRQVIAVIEPV
jgi:hypothetical protein